MVFESPRHFHKTLCLLYILGECHSPLSIGATSTNKRWLIQSKTTHYPNMLYQACRQASFSSLDSIKAKPSQATDQEVQFCIHALTSLAAVSSDPPRSANAFNPHPASCLISNIYEKCGSSDGKGRTCWQLSSFPLQGQGRHRPRGP